MRGWGVVEVVAGRQGWQSAERGSGDGSGEGERTRVVVPVACVVTAHRAGARGWRGA